MKRCHTPKTQWDYHRGNIKTHCRESKKFTVDYFHWETLRAGFSRVTEKECADIYIVQQNDKHFC